MTDPTRVPDDERVLFGGQQPGKATRYAARQKADQLKRLHDTVDLLGITVTPTGATFALGAARGRLAVLHELGLVSEKEFMHLKDTIRETFNRHCPDLQILETPGAH